MSFRAYALFGFLFIAAVGLFGVLYFTGDISVDVLGHRYMMPTSGWLVAPLIAFYLSSLVLWGVQSLTQYWRVNAYKNDFTALKELLALRLFGESRDMPFKTPEFSALASVLTQTDLAPHARFKSGDEKLDKAASAIEEIQNGKVVDMGRFKLLRDHPLMVQNALNRMGEDPRACEEILRSCKASASPLCQRAFEALVEYAEWKSIKKFDITPTKNAVFKLFSRFLPGEEGSDFTHADAQRLTALAKFTREDYVQLARIAAKKMRPDTAIEFFFVLSRDNLDAVAAYIHLNLEFEVNDRAIELLDQSDADEFLEYKAFLCLKANGANVKLAQFLGQVTATRDAATLGAANIVAI